MTDPTPLTDDELPGMREMAVRGIPGRISPTEVARLLATVDAERARADQAEAERDEMAAQLEAVLNEGLTADEFRRKYLDAGPTERAVIDAVVAWDEYMDGVEESGLIPMDRKLRTAVAPLRSERNDQDQTMLALGGGPTRPLTDLPDDDR